MAKKNLATVGMKDKFLTLHSLYDLCLSALPSATKNAHIFHCISIDVQKLSHPLCKVLKLKYSIQRDNAIK